MERAYHRLNKPTHLSSSKRRNDTIITMLTTADSTSVSQYLSGLALKHAISGKSWFTRCLGRSRRWFHPASTYGLSQAVSCGHSGARSSTNTKLDISGTLSVSRWVCSEMFHLPTRPLLPELLVQTLSHCYYTSRLCWTRMDHCVLLILGTVQIELYTMVLSSLCSSRTVILRIW